MKILLFKSSSLLSKAIRYFSRGKYHHVAIELSDGTLYEATTGQGVRKINSAKLKTKSKIDIYELINPIFKEQEEILREFLDKQVGKKYDYLMVLGFVTHSTREGRKSHNKWFCSELVCAAMEKAGVKLFNAEPWKISPETISYSTKISAH